VSKQRNIFVDAADINIFSSASAYKQQLLTLIRQAKKRIYITALYLQDDAAGQEILHALYQAKQLNVSLDIKVFVDFHRAQRGLIGEKQQLGNRALYLSFAQQYQHPIDIYGIAVKRKELFGVLHLKGMVFDEQVFYTGASINDVYCQQENRYRLDRYYQINAQALADCFCQYLDTTFVSSGFAPLLNQASLPNNAQQKRNIVGFKALLKKAYYPLVANNAAAVINKAISIKPLVGYGRRSNKLNRTIRQLVQNSKSSILLFTPYFNLPPVLARDVIKALKRGVSVTIIVGDKTANDFYISDPNSFSTIGIVPYIYEMLLRRFVRRMQPFIDQGLLTIRLWKDGDNSFHSKGLLVDKRYHLLTGSNFNPRAWSLDLENGLLLDDVNQSLMVKVEQEIQIILANTTQLKNFSDLESVNCYPEKPQKLVKKIQLTQIDRLLKRFL
jgi:CDP-diacylglycerol---serine O-phosphatidyltransferase